MRRRWLEVLAVVLIGTGCGKATYRSYAGQFCSNTQNDDPHYECSPSADLVCITTSSTLVRTDGSATSAVPLYLCAIACNPGEACASDEVCCPGMIYGKTYGKTGGCVPYTMCQYLPPPTTKTDAGHDGSATGDGGADAADAVAGEDGPADGPADALAASDAGDVPTTDAGTD